MSYIGMPYLVVSTYILKELVHLLEEHFQTPVNKLSSINVNYLKIPKKHPRLHKTPLQATCRPSFETPGVQAELVIFLA